MVDRASLGVIVADEDRIRSAIKEIAFCDDLRVKVSNGEIVAIHAQVIQRPSKHGVDTTHTIKEVITK